MPTTPPREGAQHAFDDQLAHDAAARGAHRAANCEFALTRCAASEKQVRDVGAGDEQNQRDHGEQHQDLRAGVALHDVAAARAWLEDDLFGEEGLAFLFVEIGVLARFSWSSG